MALTITVSRLQGRARTVAVRRRFPSIAPRISDYPTGGYPITAAQLSLGNLYGAPVLASNAAAALFTPKFVLPAGRSVATSSDLQPINLEVTVADVQMPAVTDLSACKWSVTFAARASKSKFLRGAKGANGHCAGGSHFV